MPFYTFFSSHPHTGFVGRNLNDKIQCLESHIQIVYWVLLFLRLVLCSVCILLYHGLFPRCYSWKWKVTQLNDFCRIPLFGGHTGFTVLQMRRSSRRKQLEPGVSGIILFGILSLTNFGENSHAHKLHDEKQTNAWWGLYQPVWFLYCWWQYASILFYVSSVSSCHEIRIFLWLYHVQHYTISDH